jgi:AcrR family transcriptional regulator
MGRPRTFDADAVVAQVAALVAERGYDAVGIDDVVRVTGVARGSLYHHFGSKAGIIAASLAVVAAAGDDDPTIQLVALVLASSGARDPLIAVELSRLLADLGRRHDLPSALGTALLGRHPDLSAPSGPPAPATRTQRAAA